MAKATTWEQDYGTDTPINDAYLLSYPAGAIRLNNNPTTLATGLIGWACTVAGHPGTWVELWGGAGGTGIPRVANIAALAAIVTTSYSTTQAHLAEVLTVGDFFKHSPTGGRGTWSNVTAYAIGDVVFYSGSSYVSIQAGTGNIPSSATTFWTKSLTVVAAAVGTSIWNRVGLRNPYWQKQTVWYIDPAGTNSTPGDDELDGLTSSTPIKSIAEWRRRIDGAAYNATVTINALSSSTVIDDATIAGFTTGIGSSAFVVLKGTITVLYSGTVTGYSSPTLNGDNRGYVEDTAIPVSWTASTGVTTTSGSRFIRKTGGAVGTPHAALLIDLGSKRVQIGVADDTREVPVGIGGLSSTLTNFIVGDTYEVYRQTSWRLLPVTQGSGKVRVNMMDFQSGSGEAGSSTAVFALCGILSLSTTTDMAKSLIYMNCVFAAGGTFSASAVAVSSCSFMNGPSQVSGTPGAHWGGTHNIFVNSPFMIRNGSWNATLGALHFYDTGASTCLTVRRLAWVELEGIQGTGNTGKLLLVTDFGVAWGGSTISATATTDALPIQLNTIAYPIAALAVVDDTNSGAIYI